MQRDAVIIGWAFTGPATTYLARAPHSINPVIAAVRSCEAER
ncbi:hypothetical protein FHU14_000006 [Mesorhizobium sp. RMAD-H1]|nr:hypothetical protein [Mesorhizobium sp. RMAD-H1]